MSPCRALIRVRVPDRPGALGLVASRIGAVKGDIVGIEVLDRHDGTALDQLSVILPDADLIPTLEREIAEVDGAEVAGVTIVDAFPEPRLDEVEYALALSRAPRRRDAERDPRRPRASPSSTPTGAWRVVPASASVPTGGPTPIAETVTESIELPVSGITLSFAAPRAVAEGRARARRRVLRSRRRALAPPARASRDESGRRDGSTLRVTEPGSGALRPR